MKPAPVPSGERPFAEAKPPPLATQAHRKGEIRIADVVKIYGDRKSVV